MKDEENKNKFADAQSFGEAKKSEAALREEKILEFWRENKIFEKSLQKKSPRGEFVFYDGPPFATGLPHYGSLLSSIVKDVIPRYKTMRGYKVRRRWGWDCHGLPIENMIEKELDLKSKKDIEALGVDKFNQRAKFSVLRYASDWKAYVDRVGRWVDFDNSYKTMDNSYIESVWWALSEINKKGLLYEGRKVLLYCPHCETPLAKAEIAMDNSYKDVTEEAVTVKFKVKNPEKNNLPAGTHILAWTTTPWTLPGNVGLAVGENISYILNDQDLIFAKNLLDRISGVSKGVKKEFKGSELSGLEYEPLFEIPKVKASGKKSHLVLPADFVTTEDGTGVVHTAVIYGEDDYNLGVKNELPMVPLLNSSGHFNEDAPEFIHGIYLKKASKMVVEDLERRGLLFEKSQNTHSYPHCYRCDTPLIYNAISSWFINIQKIKRNIISEAEKINWFPEFLKHGRFLHILEGAPDWAISRNRYWASPLPIWKCGSCPEFQVLSSVKELKNSRKKSGNKYFVMRHGGTEGNQAGIVSYKNQLEDDLTRAGEEETHKSATVLKDKNIDYIITSPFTRTRETAEIVREVLGIPKENVVEEYDLREVDPGKFDGQSWDKYHEHVYNVGSNWFEQKIDDGESLYDVKVRTGRVLYDLEAKYKGKNILIITHGGPAWLLYVNAGLFTPDNKEYVPENHYVFVNEFKKFGNAEVRELPFIPVPHDQNYDLDLHRPYIDEVKFGCVCGGEMSRIPEVVDCWVESGSMPFAEHHYPFENQDLFEKRYPGDFITEYIAQTRTWFYYTHVLSVALFGKNAFKNVLTTGNILATDGQKLSKSKKNFTDPMVNLDLFGADALRYYLMSSVVLQAEDVKFADQEVKEVQNRVFNILWNVYKFYELYPMTQKWNFKPESSNVLNTWILARLSAMILEMEKNLDQYNTVKAARLVRDFVEDFSTWYLRRSRERIKEGDLGAKETLYFVLKNLVKVFAPIAPFMAESIWQGLRGEADPESVHLEKWPEVSKSFLEFFTRKEAKVLKDMADVREYANAGHMLRQKENIGVRQPLSEFFIPVDLGEEYKEILQEELNVKKVSTGSEVKLVTSFTPALRAEGEHREFIRELQDQRKQLGLMPGDRMPMSVETVYKKYKIMPTLELHMLRVAASAKLICDNFVEPLSEEVKNTIISACLLHDMGNILKFQLDYFPGFVEPEGLEYWEGVKSEYKEKYGADEHLASLQIAKEVSEKGRVLELIEGFSFLGVSQTTLLEDFDKKIAEYCDGRANPFGVVSLEQRFLDFRERYGQKRGDTPERLAFEEALRKIETQIFAKCKIKPEDINDQTVAPIIEELKKFVIK